MLRGDYRYGASSWRHRRHPPTACRPCGRCAEQDQAATPTQLRTEARSTAIPRLRMHIAEKRLLRSCIEATERRVRMSQGPPAPNAAVALPVS